jgi:hypothetical protein
MFTPWTTIPYRALLHDLLEFCKYCYVLHYNFVLFSQQSGRQETANNKQQHHSNCILCTKQFVAKCISETFHKIFADFHHVVHWYRPAGYHFCQGVDG